MLCELSVDKLRFYYEISAGIIWISEVKYLWEVKVLNAYSNHKSGDSNNYSNQRKYIKILKKWFQNKFK